VVVAGHCPRTPKSVIDLVCQVGGALFVFWFILREIGDMARLSQGAEFMKLQIEPVDPPAGFGKYVVKDVFTTMDGSWDLNGTIFSITSWARNGYLKPMGAPDYFDDAGGATHLFARVEDENGRPLPKDVRFFTGNLTVTENTGRKKSGWANMFMNGDSAFYVEQGQRGPWSAVPFVPHA